MKHKSIRACWTSIVETCRNIPGHLFNAICSSLRHNMIPYFTSPQIKRIRRTNDEAGAGGKASESVRGQRSTDGSVFQSGLKRRSSFGRMEILNPLV